MQGINWGNYVNKNLVLLLNLILVFSWIYSAGESLLLMFFLPIIAFYFIKANFAKLFLIFPTLLLIPVFLFSTSDFLSYPSDFISFYGLFYILIIVTLTVNIMSFFINYGQDDFVKEENSLDRETKFILYIVSLLIPIAGIIIGAIYVSKNEQNFKIIGKNCMLCSLFSIITSFMIFILIILP